MAPLALTTLELQPGNSALIMADTHIIPPLFRPINSERYWRRRLGGLFDPMLKLMAPDDTMILAGDIAECTQPDLNTILQHTMGKVVGGILANCNCIHCPGNHDPTLEGIIPGVRAADIVRLHHANLPPADDILVTHGHRLNELFIPPDGEEPDTNFSNRSADQNERRQTLTRQCKYLSYFLHALDPLSFFLDGGPGKNVIRIDEELSRLVLLGDARQIVHAHVHEPHDRHQTRLENGQILERTIVGKSHRRHPRFIQVVAEDDSLSLLRHDVRRGHDFAYEI